MRHISTDDDSSNIRKKYLFLAGDTDGLYVSYQYSNYINRKHNSEVDLLWQSAVAKSLPSKISKEFDNSYTYGQVKEYRRLTEIFSRLPTRNPKNVIEYISFNLKSVASKIDFSTYDGVFIFKDTSLRDRSLLKKLSDNTTIVLIEEGLGLYTSQRQAMHPDIDFIICSFPNIFMKFRPEVKNKISRKNIQPLSISLYSPSRVTEFIEGWTQRGCFDFSNNIDILYVGQYFSGEIEHFKSILNNVPVESTVLIKPHPQENQNKYSDISDSRVSIADFDSLPVELVVSYIKPSIIVTPYSTAGVKLTRLYGMKSIYTFRLLEKHMDVISKIGKELNIVIPTSEDELRSELEKSTTEFTQLKEDSCLEELEAIIENSEIHK